MTFSRDYSNKSKPAPKKKIPLGRFIILGLLFWWGYSQFAPKSTPKTDLASKGNEKTAKTSTDHKNSSSQKVLSSSSKPLPPDLKVSRWENDDGTFGARVDYYRSRVEAEQLLDTTKVPQKWIDYLFFSYQNCSDTAKIRVRFLSQNDLIKWSYECDQSINAFYKKAGQWVDSLGCALPGPCFTKLADNQNLILSPESNRKLPHFYAFKTSGPVPLYSPTNTVLIKRDVSPESCLYFDLSLGKILIICGKWQENPPIKIDQKLNAGQLIGNLASDQMAFIRYHRDGYTLSLKDILPWLDQQQDGP